MAGGVRDSRKIFCLHACAACRCRVRDARKVSPAITTMYEHIASRTFYWHKYNGRTAVFQTRKTSHLLGDLWWKKVLTNAVVLRALESYWFFCDIKLMKRSSEKSAD